jgi:hypothetical protein
MERRMHDLDDALAETTAIRSPMAGSVEFRGYDSDAVPDAAAADPAEASL